MTAAGAAARHARAHLLVAFSIVALTLLGFYSIPGHTFLQSDSQIYLPILEHLRDPSVLGRDLVAQDPHVSFTVYDEMALLLRRLTGLDFHAVLVLQQLVCRALALLGVYLLATSLQLRMRAALLVVAAFSLGATIWGPAVLTIEYEPVPRGFAVALLLLALGLVAHGRALAAGAAAAAAFLYHPPSVAPFWAVYFALTLWPARPAVIRRRILGLLPMLAGAAVLLVLYRMQPAMGEPQGLWGTISPELERVQRLRAPYNWLSTWPGYAFTHYLFLWAVSLAAFWRVRKWASQDLRFFLTGLPLYGMLMLPVSYVLLERMKWIAIPQLQPARALLFVTALAVISGAVAAVKAAGQRRYWESALWFLVVFAVPAQTRTLSLLTPDLSDPLIRARLLVVAGLAVLATVAVWALDANKRWALAPWTLAVLLPFYALPHWAHVQNYGPLDSPELQQLSAWARASTPRDAVFFFPDAGRDLSPGVFRANALRAVYVDWKSGGQVNFLKGFAQEWWSRWQKAGADTYPGAGLARYRLLGIDYIVLRVEHRLDGAPPAYENRQFLVYRTAISGTSPPLTTSQRL